MAAHDVVATIPFAVVREVHGMLDHDILVARDMSAGILARPGWI
jgi:hypothetical protein